MNANRPAGRLSIPKSFLSFLMRIKNRFNAKTVLVVIGILIFCVFVVLILRIFDCWADTLDMMLGTEKLSGDLSSKTETIRMLRLTLFGLFVMFGLAAAHVTLFNAKNWLILIRSIILILLVALILRMLDVGAYFLDEFFGALFGARDIDGGMSRKTQTLLMLGFAVFGLSGIFGLIVTYSRAQTLFNAKNWLVFIGSIVLILFVALILRMFDIRADFLDTLFGVMGVDGGLSSKTQTLRILGLTLFGLSGILGLIVAYLRAEALFEGNQAVFQANRDKVFTDAINHLGKKNSDSVRLGGIYGLYNLIDLEPERLPNIVNILCAHLRETTRQKEYKKEYQNKPSNEIQSLLNVLGKINTKSRNSGPIPPLFDLSDSYLCGADLKNINLSGARLHRARLVRADLSGANLNEAILEEANLRGADLSKAGLQRADFSGADLQETILTDAELPKAYLIGADLRKAELIGADLRKAELIGADLRKAELIGADLRKAKLINADLRKAELTDANLQEAHLNSADLRKAELIDASLQGAKLIGADLQGTDLSGAGLQGADLGSTSLQETIIRGAGWQGANLEDAGLQGANLRGAGLQGADLGGAYLQGADLSGARLQGADLGGAYLQGADLGGADLQGAYLGYASMQGTYLKDAGLEGAFSSPKPDQVEKTESFEERINKRRGKDTELTKTVFSGGISANEFNRIEQNLTQSRMAPVRINEIMTRIRPHLGKKKSVQLPTNSGAMTGVLTNEMAKQIIKDYKKAMRPALKYWQGGK